MCNRAQLEVALYDIDAKLRVLRLLNEADDDKTVWERYQLPPKDHCDLKLTPCRDALAARLTLGRLERLAAEAIAALPGD